MHRERLWHIFKAQIFRILQTLLGLKSARPDVAVPAVPSSAKEITDMSALSVNICNEVIG